MRWAVGLVWYTFFFVEVSSAGEQSWLPGMFGEGGSDAKQERSCDESACTIYMMRFLNHLLRRTNLQGIHLAPGMDVKVPMKLYFNSTSLQIIQAYATKRRHEYTWADLDKAMFLLFEEKLAQHAEEIEETPRFFQPDIRPEFIIVVVIGSIVLIAFWLVLTGVSLTKTFLLVFTIAFSIGLGFTWWIEIEEKRIEALVTLAEMNSIPEECISTSSTYMNQIKTWLFGSSKKCKQYHWAQVDPMKKVVFSNVLAKTFTSMCMTPLPIIGDALGHMTANYTSRLSWLSEVIAWIIVPIVSPIFALMCIIFLMTIILGRGFRVSLPFFSYSSQPVVEPIREPVKVTARQKKFLKTARHSIKDSNFSRNYFLVQKSRSEGNFLEDKTRSYYERHPVKKAIRQRSDLTLSHFDQPRRLRQKMKKNMFKDSESEESSYQDKIEYKQPSSKFVPTRIDSDCMEESEYSMINYDERSSTSGQSDIAVIPETETELDETRVLKAIN
ncbi:uncharacterized protein LOC106663237 [Cimex lectularius]|uniref:Chloride channel CLIC-like protein 1 n=1 Tax=Cimex lectularius TaxID=79782 RepID=A0A8I6SQ02_CIMLE|nr:uncharacterized protein LOC106663237 [Cimex lectularius]XP_024082703.1 uncharacterized protein LOC106663237 [Cimex lectularius]